MRKSIREVRRELDLRATRNGLRNGESKEQIEDAKARLAELPDDRIRVIARKLERITDEN